MAEPRYDPFDPGVLDDPYPWYRWLRANSPCHFVEERDLFVVTRHADAIAVLRDAETFSSAQGITYGEGIDANLGIVTTDPPHHGHLRKIVSRSFAPKAIAAREPALDELVDALVDEALERGTVDAVQAFSLPLPTTVISEMLGVPSADREEFRRWSVAIVELFDDRLGAAQRAEAEVARQECRDYLRAMIDERLADVDSGATDVITTLLDAQDGGSLTPRETLAFAMTLLVAGNETTGNAISNGLAALLHNPDQFERLRRQPDLLSSAVEETLRYDAAVQGFTRVATVDTEVAGVAVPAGARLLVLFGAANRDAELFAEGDTFLVDRNPRGFLAFGAGPHTCLGGPLARLEMGLLFGRLLERTAAILPVAAEKRHSTPFHRGIDEFELHLVAA
jgi:cytochrome P450